VTGAWLSEAVELEAYEGIRRGDEEAFRLLAQPLNPTLRRLAGLYLASAPAADDSVLHTWGVTLRGLSMFRWHTPLATWVAGIAVGSGRAHVGRAARHQPASAAPRLTRKLPGPDDWSDLPWGARWEPAGARLARTLAALPTPELEVLHGRDGEQWPPRRVCDVFGLPGVTYELLLANAHAQLLRALGLLVGQPEPSPHDDARIAAMSSRLPRPTSRAVRVTGARQSCGPRRTCQGSSTGTGADRAKRPSRVSNVALSVSAHAM
jgi:DNA-directed RNA polymerase specialized sigma24 family protein